MEHLFRFLTAYYPAPAALAKLARSRGSATQYVLDQRLRRTITGNYGEVGDLAACCAATSHLGQVIS
ncbi:hypothetical protein CK227_24770 [Mesorhizobium sp. WSM4308]|nr:hypothetical protein CK232_24595 [Mesorhizobium sp. WSM4304]PBB72885.1 hypothetical protein CK227_24770 [Mesorhizobium sp. WSM4308]